MLFKFAILYYFSYILEIVCGGFATINVRLDSFNLNLEERPFMCHNRDPNFKSSGDCDVDIIILPCSASSANVLSARMINKAYNQQYVKRYQNEYFENLTAELKHIFQTRNDTNLECFKGQNYIHRFYNTMNLTLENSPILNLTFDVTNWNQNIVVWFGAITHDFFYETWPNAVWLAELFTNNDFISNDISNATYVYLKKVTSKFGTIPYQFQYYTLHAAFAFNISYKCLEFYKGIKCSIECRPNEAYQCDEDTGNQICNPGWLPTLIPSNLIFGPAYFQKCNIKDGCYRHNCDPLQCIRIGSGKSICTLAEAVIEPSKSCLPVGQSVDCVFKLDVTANFSWSSRWTFDSIDNGVIIINETIKFEESILQSMPYTCIITIDSFIPKQTFSKNFTFMVYELVHELDLNITAEIVVYGQTLSCITLGWFMSMVKCNMVAVEPEKLVLDKFEENYFSISPKSKFGETTLIITALLFTNCNSSAAFTLTKQFQVYVKGYKTFDWISKSQNLFYKNESENIFDCEVIPTVNTHMVEVITIEYPKEPPISGFEYTDFLAGTYYVACQLNFMGSDYTEILYKYLHMNFVPNETNIFVYVNETYMDSFVKCLPLPYPEEDYHYSISFYDGIDPRRKIGYIEHHSVSPIPFDVPNNVSTLIRCSVTPKNNRSAKVEVDSIVTFNGWKRPIKLRIWRIREWSLVFVASALLLFIIIPLSWIIYMKSTRSISGTFLTRRTLVLTNLKRRNTTLYNKFLEWIENINLILISTGTESINVEEAQKMVKRNDDLRLDFYLYLKGQTKGYDTMMMKEKISVLRENIRMLRNSPNV